LSGVVCLPMVVIVVVVTVIMMAVIMMAVIAIMVAIMVVVVTIVVAIVLAMLLAPVIALLLPVHIPFMLLMCAHFLTEVLFTLALVEFMAGRVHIVIPALGHEVDRSSAGVVLVTMSRPVPLVARWHM
jgi:hypothetical protein